MDLETQEINFHFQQSKQRKYDKNTWYFAGRLAFNLLVFCLGCAYYENKKVPELCTCLLGL